MFVSEFRNEKIKPKILTTLKITIMKVTKRNLTLSITIALISVISISIGATAVRNTKNAHTRFYVRSAENTKSIQTRLINYKGELIPFIQLHEVVISGKAIQKKK
jgi:hypothetical protein